MSLILSDEACDDVLEGSHLCANQLCGVEVMLLVVEIKFLMWNTQATYPFSYRARDCIREWYVIVSAFENKWESETTLLPIVYFWYRPIKLCSIN
jgi:hypothetical protein